MTVRSNPENVVRTRANDSVCQRQSKLYNAPSIVWLNKQSRATQSMSVKLKASSRKIENSDSQVDLSIDARINFKRSEAAAHMSPSHWHKDSDLQKILPEYLYLMSDLTFN